VNRLDAMLQRLPPPYAIEEGNLVRALLAVAELQLRVFDEDMDRVQRSHWVDTAFAREDLARLGALFDVPPAPWEPLRLYRARLIATVAAQLRGSVTPAQIDRVLAAILDGALDALGTRYLPTGVAAPGRSRLPVTEFPPSTRRSQHLLGSGALVQPLTRFDAVNQGLGPVPAQLAIYGVPGGDTAMPVLVNRTTGHAIGWRGVVPAGRALAIRTTGGQVVATLDGEPVSELLWSTADFRAGPGRPPLPLDDPVAPLLLERGANALRLITLGRYGDPGLDAAAHAVASEALRQGRWASADGTGEAGPTATGDGTAFDDSVFQQGPAAVLDLWWVERRSASFRVDVPAGVVSRPRGRRADPEADRDELFRLLQDTVDRLRAAAVVGVVAAVRLREEQRAADRLRVLAAQQERASAGVDRVAASSALFDITSREESRYE
jgi:hypothetical protein